MAGRNSKSIDHHSEFSLKVNWPTQGVEPEGERLTPEEATMGRLSIDLRGESVTSFKSDKGDTGTAVDVPTIHLAEWLANNYWALLYEPKKTEQDDDASFKARHWLGVARNGFALPDLWIFSSGQKVEISAWDVYLRFARLSFLTRATHQVDRDLVENSLKGFIDDVARRVIQLRLDAPEFLEAWELVKNTTPEEALYCRLVGSLGCNPYDERPEIDGVLEGLAEQLSPNALLDLCQAADPASLRHMGEEASAAFRALPSAQKFEARELHSIDVPSDREDFPAWKWGVAASDRMRQHLGISAREPEGGDELLRHFGIHAGANSIHLTSANDYSRVMGALGAEEGPDATVRLALSEHREQQRRFSAARAIFLAWSRENKATGRLLTAARTRDQQASRAFAAELLAPISYIRSRSGASYVSTYRLDEIAQELQVSSAVVRYQAQNNKMHVVE